MAASIGNKVYFSTTGLALALRFRVDSFATYAYTCRRMPAGIFFIVFKPKNSKKNSSGQMDRDARMLQINPPLMLREKYQPDGNQQ